MARVVLAHTAFAAGMAAAQNVQGLTFAERMDFMNPTNVPSSDDCGADCVDLCSAKFSQNILKPPASCGMACGEPSWMVTPQRYCQEACWAHSIETTREATWWSPQTQQGKYVQKVMAEFCSRGLCSGSSLAEVQAHEHTEAGKERDGQQWGYPAKASGWPDTCQSQSYTCTQLCENMFHEPSDAYGLGNHPGADSNWQANRQTCEQNCNKDFRNVQKVFNGFCKCTKKKGMPSLPPAFIQEPHTKAPAVATDDHKDAEAGSAVAKVVEAAVAAAGSAEHGQPEVPESTDVGAFMQMPAEL